MPPSGQLWNCSWITRVLWAKNCPWFCFCKTVIGTYYFPGNGILSRLHEQTECGISKRRIFFSCPNSVTFSLKLFLSLAKEGSGSIWIYVNTFWWCAIKCEPCQQQQKKVTHLGHRAFMLTHSNNIILKFIICLAASNN